MVELNWQLCLNPPNYIPLQIFPIEKPLKCTVTILVLCNCDIMGIFLVTGWDISSKNLADAMWNACVLDSNLQEQLRPYMKTMKPRPSIYCPDFIAANQADRADNLLKGRNIVCNCSSVRKTLIL